MICTAAFLKKALMKQQVLTEEEIDTSIDITVFAFLPERYISEASQRIDIYKKIALIETDEDKMEIEDEMIDRYGDIPRAAQNVIRVGLIKSRAKKAGITDIIQNGEIVTVKFAKADIAILIGLAKSEPAKYKLVPGDVPCIRMKFAAKNGVLSEIEGMLMNFEK